jgi:plastocyanin
MLLALTLAAAPVALASAAKRHAKSRCAGRAYAKRHKRQCHKPQPLQQRGAGATSTAGPTGTATTAPPPLPDAQAPGTATPGVSTTPTSRIGVTAKEYSLTLSRTTVAAGASIVQLQNFGQDPHNLRVERVDGTGTPADLPETAPDPRKSQSRTVSLSAGTYKLYCTLPRHDGWGMHATLTVTG